MTFPWDTLCYLFVVVLVHSVLSYTRLSMETRVGLILSYLLKIKLYILFLLTEALPGFPRVSPGTPAFYLVTAGFLQLKAG